MISARRSGRVKRPGPRTAGISHGAPRGAARLLSLAALAALALLVTSGSRGQESPALEYQVKAAFLYNFARFVEWPAREASPSAEITIGVLGSDPFGEALDRTIAGKSVNGRALKVVRLKDARDAPRCQILFVELPTESALAGVLEAVGRAPVLTVGDAESFTRKGGVIRFFMEDNKVRFAINVDAAQRAGLKISSKLLALAKVIRDTERGGS